MRCKMTFIIIDITDVTKIIDIIWCICHCKEGIYRWTTNLDMINQWILDGKLIIIIVRVIVTRCSAWKIGGNCHLKSFI